MGKKYIDSAKLIDRTKAYEPAEALELVCQTSKAKFDETIEIHIRLGVDSRHADQQVRGAVVLPNGTGKSVKVLVFAKGDNIEKAQAYFSASEPFPMSWLFASCGQSIGASASVFPMNFQG